MDRINAIEYEPTTFLERLRDRNWTREHFIVKDIKPFYQTLSRIEGQPFHLKNQTSLRFVKMASTQFIPSIAADIIPPA